MPIYEYYCKLCDLSVELQQKFSAKTTIKCPECGRSIKRIISRVGSIIFKGDGFTPKFY